MTKTKLIDFQRYIAPDDLEKCKKIFSDIRRMHDDEVKKINAINSPERQHLTHEFFVRMEEVLQSISSEQNFSSASSNAPKPYILQFSYPGMMGSGTRAVMLLDQNGQPYQDGSKQHYCFSNDIKLNNPQALIDSLNLRWYNPFSWNWGKDSSAAHAVPADDEETLEKLKKSFERMKAGIEQVTKECSEDKNKNLINEINNVISYGCKKILHDFKILEDGIKLPTDSANPSLDEFVYGDKYGQDKLILGIYKQNNNHDFSQITIDSKKNKDFSGVVMVHRIDPISKKNLEECDVMYIEKGIVVNIVCPMPPPNLSNSMVAKEYSKLNIRQAKEKGLEPNIDVISKEPWAQKVKDPVKKPIPSR